MFDTNKSNSLKILIILFPVLFSIIGFLGYLSNGNIINCIFFFVGLLLTILTGYILKVLLFNKGSKKELNDQICGIFLPNNLFKRSTISLNQMFYGYIIIYIFGLNLLNSTLWDIKGILSFITLLAFSVFDGFFNSTIRCSTTTEIFFGFILGLCLAVFMLSLRNRYYDEYYIDGEKPYRKKECGMYNEKGILGGNKKYICKENEEQKKNRQKRIEDEIKDYNKVNLVNSFSHIWFIVLLAPFVIFLQYILINISGFSKSIGKGSIIFSFIIMAILILLPLVVHGSNTTFDNDILGYVFIGLVSIPFLIYSIYFAVNERNINNGY